MICQLFLSLLFVCHSIEHSPKSKGEFQQPLNQFTFDIQHGGDPYNKYDLRGQTNYNKFIKAFDEFPWLNEIDKANANPNGCSPTLSAKYKTGLKDLWVSMSGDRRDNGYLIGYAHVKYINGKTIKWLEIYLPNNKQEVKNLFGLFFTKEFDRLEKELLKLEKFKEMEAQN